VSKCVCELYIRGPYCQLEKALIAKVDQGTGVTLRIPWVAIRMGRKPCGLNMRRLRQ
jgi:hypothetical protein